MSTEPYIIQHYKNDKANLDGSFNLSLIINNEEFMFAIFTKIYGELVELCSVRYNVAMQHGNNNVDRVQFLINNFQLVGKKYENVNISLLNSDFTILPEAFAVKENSKDILEFSSGRDSKNTFTHQFNNLSFNYFIDSELIRFLERTFKNASFRHSGAAAINLLFSNRSLKKCDVFLNFNEGVFELIAKENNNLLYYNVFNYETKEDVMYFLLFMMEQFKLDQNKIKLMVAGQIEIESDLYKGLKKYIKHIEFAVNDITLNNNFKDVKIPNHFYFTLLNQHLCEL
jgi:hypothetical protein